MPAKGWIEVSDTYCKGCELCLSVCPQEVMELDMTRLTPKGYHPAHTFKDGCTGCAICALVCPDAAITVYREITKAAASTSRPATTPSWNTCRRDNDTLQASAGGTPETVQ